MTRSISRHELLSGEVLETVAAGESSVVTRNGEPVAELRPIRSIRRTFASRAGIAAPALADVCIDREQSRADLGAEFDQS